MAGINTVHEWLGSISITLLDLAVLLIACCMQARLAGKVQQSAPQLKAQQPLLNRLGPQLTDTSRLDGQNAMQPASKRTSHNSEQVSSFSLVQKFLFEPTAFVSKKSVLTLDCPQSGVALWSKCSHWSLISLSSHRHGPCRDLK